MMPPPSPDALQARARLSAVGPLLALPVLLGFVVVGVPLQVSHKGVGLWLSEVLVFFAVPWVALGRFGLAPAEAAGLRPARWRALAVGALVGALNYAAWVVPIQALMERVLPASLTEGVDPADLFRRLSAAELALVLTAVGVAAPVCEEVFFRGAVQRGLEGRVSGPRAVVVTAVLFTLFHFDLVGLLARFELGLVFGLLAWRTQSLWAGIGAHAANNLVSTLTFFAAEEAGGPSDALPWWVPVGGLVLGNLGLALAAKGLFASALPAAEPPTLTLTAPRPWAKALAPFALTLALAVGGVAAFDGRQVVLNWVDALNPVADEAERRGLDALRARARRGEASVSEYRAAREAAAQTKR